MKRCYLGAGVLLVLLIFGIFSSRWLEKHYEDLENRMYTAAMAEPEDMPALVESIRARWDRGRLLTAILADHQHPERAAVAFSQLSPAMNRRDKPECTRLCLEIAHIFRMLKEEQQLKWENLL